MTYCKLHIRMIPFPQRSCKYFRMEHVSPNKLVRGNVTNEINSFSIAEGFFSLLILRFVPTSYSNTTTPQSQVTAVKLKPLKLLPGNLSDLEYAKT
jgi:hypothetical protein